MRGVQGPSLPVSHPPRAIPDPNPVGTVSARAQTGRTERDIAQWHGLPRCRPPPSGAPPCRQQRAHHGDHHHGQRQRLQRHGTVRTDAPCTRALPRHSETGHAYRPGLTATAIVCAGR